MQITTYTEALNAAIERVREAQLVYKDYAGWDIPYTRADALADAAKLLRHDLRGTDYERTLWREALMVSTDTKAVFAAKLDPPEFGRRVARVMDDYLTKCCADLIADAEGELEEAA